MYPIYPCKMQEIVYKNQLPKFVCPVDNVSNMLTASPKEEPPSLYGACRLKYRPNWCLFSDSSIIKQILILEKCLINCQIHQLSLTKFVLYTSVISV